MKERLAALLWRASQSLVAVTLFWVLFCGFCGCGRAFVPNTGIGAQVEQILLGLLALGFVFWLASITVLAGLRAWRNPRIRRLLGVPLQAASDAERAADEMAARLRATPAQELAAYPWVLLLGPSGAGKSTLLRRSQLPLHLADNRSRQPGEGPTQGIELVRCGDLLVVDTPGRLVDGSQADDLHGALRALAAHRGGAGFGAVAVCVSLPELVTEEGQRPGVLPATLEAALRRIEETLGQVLPRHLLLTQVDRVAGMDELLAVLPDTVRASALGHPFPLRDQVQDDPRPRVRVAWEGIAAAVEAHRAHVLRALGDASAEPDRLGRPLLLGAQLRSARDAVVRMAAAAAVGPSGTPRLAGLWLLAARQGGAAVDAVTPELTRAWGLRAREPDGGRGHARGERPAFVRGLLTEVLPRYRAGGQAVAGAAAQAWRGALAAYSVVGALALVALGVVVAPSAYALAYLDRVQTLVLRVTAPATGDSTSCADDERMPSCVYALGDQAFGWVDLQADVHEEAWRRAWPEEDPDIVGLRGAALYTNWAVADDLQLLLAQLLSDRVFAGVGERLTKGLRARNPRPGFVADVPWAPLPTEIGQWATQTWLALDLASRLQRWGTPPEAGGLSVGEVDVLAADLGEYLGLGTEAFEQRLQRTLLLRWLHGPRPSKVNLPGPAELETAKAALGELCEADVVYSRLLQADKVGWLRQDSRVLRWESVAELRLGPPGFSTRSCQRFWDPAAHEGIKGSLPATRSCANDAGKSTEDLVREKFERGHPEEWEAWLGSFRVGAATPATSLAEAEEDIRDLFRPTTGDLDEVLRALPTRTLPATGEGDPPPLPEQCRLLADPWRVGEEMTGADGPRASDWQAAQAAMIGLAEQLKKARNDPAVAEKLTRETFGRGGPLIEAYDAVDRVLVALDAPVGAPPEGNPAVEANARRAVTELIRQSRDAALVQAWELLVRDYARQVNQRWAQEVLPAWSPLRGQFPLDRSSQRDADPAKLEEVFGEKGLVFAFLDTWLTATGDDRGGDPPWGRARSASVTGAVQYLRRKKADHARYLASIGGTFRLTFSSPRVHFGNTVRKRIIVRGAETWDHEFDRAITATVEVAMGDTLSFDAGRNPAHGSWDCAEVKYGGTWAVLRFLSEGSGRLRDEPLGTFRSKDCDWRWDYTSGGGYAGGVRPEELRAYLEDLDLPGQVFDVSG